MVILQRIAWHARFDPITGAHEGRGCTATDRTLAGLLAPGESEDSATRRATRQIRTLREGGWIDVATQGRGKGSRVIRIGQRTLDELRETWEVISARNTDMGVGISREGDLENTDISSSRLPTSVSVATDMDVGQKEDDLRRLIEEERARAPHPGPAGDGIPTPDFGRGIPSQATGVGGLAEHEEQDSPANDLLRWAESLGARRSWLDMEARREGRHVLLCALEGARDSETIASGKQIGSITGFLRCYVESAAEYERGAPLPPAARDAVCAGHLGASKARKLLDKHGPERLARVCGLATAAAQEGSLITSYAQEVAALLLEEHPGGPVEAPTHEDLPGDGEDEVQEDPRLGRPSSKAQAARVNRYRKEAEHVLAILNKARTAVEPTARAYSPSYVNLDGIASCFERGQTVDDCLYVIQVRREECRYDSDAFQRLNTVVMWSHTCFAVAFGQVLPGGYESDYEDK